MSLLRLVSLNIERSKHLDRVVPFLERTTPDVVCIQELLEHDLLRISSAIGASDHIFSPMSRLMTEVPGAVYGTGVFSRFSIVAQGEQYYVGEAGALPESDPSDPLTYNDENRTITWIDIEKDGVSFRVATTHFTWTPNGQPDDRQRQDMKAMLQELEGRGEFVLAGDFNAPRGGEIFAMLAGKYKDNIPLRYKTSIDVALHRAGKLRPEELADKMVDGLFSTPGSVVSGVELVAGVSDHMAIVATVSRS